MKKQTSLQGYTGRASSILRKAGVEVGDDILLRTEREVFEGVLMPRSNLSKGDCIVVKLSNGYNIGLASSKVEAVELKGKGREPAFSPPPRPESISGLPKVVIIGTGGTIASRIDYRTGGVKPALTSEELYHLVPELASIADVSTSVIFNIYSENMTPRHWSKLAGAVAAAVKAGARGVVVTHGTDTMHYTSAALSFALESVPVPVVLVGSQRSSDRPSSDSAVNMIGAVKFAATASVSGVYVVMHAGPSDDVLAVHSGVRVRKLHTSRRDAFQTVNGRPVGFIKDGEVTIKGALPPRRDSLEGFSPSTSFSDRVALLKVYPGMGPGPLDSLVSDGCRGIVLEGTGLGHAPHSTFRSIGQAIRRGVVVAMTSQCISGSVRMTVYDTGRDLLSLGVVPLGDMLSEVALVKLSWLLARSRSSSEVASLMVSNLRGELVERRTL